MIGALGTRDFVLVMAAWGIKKGYVVEKEEVDLPRKIYEALEDDIQILIVEEKFYEKVYPEIKIIRSENPERIFIVSFIPGPSWKRLERNPVEALMREAIGFEIRRG